MIRDSEEKVMNLLKKVTVKDKDGKEFPIAVVYANKERLEQIAVRKVEDKDVIRLPMVGFQAETITRNAIRFKGNIWALYRQDMNQIIEGLFKLEDEAKDGVNGESRLSFGSFNIEDEPTDKKMTVLKANFDFYYAQ